MSQLSVSYPYHTYSVTVFPDKIFSMTFHWWFPDKRPIPWHFPDNCKIPWHFQFFQKSSHPLWGFTLTKTKQGTYIHVQHWCYMFMHQHKLEMVWSDRPYHFRLLVSSNHICLITIIVIRWHAHYISTAVSTQNSSIHQHNTRIKTALTYKGPALWNNLPNDLKMYQCTTTFKLKLKNYPTDNIYIQGRWLVTWLVIICYLVVK